MTSIDVARKCGVSQSTVSLVFSGKAKGRISARTEAAVRSAAEELGYRPNAAARALKTGAARAIVLVVPDITNPFFGGLLRGAQTAARAAGYAVALIDTDNDREWGSASAEALRAGLADGLLLFEVDPPPFSEGGEPIVVIESESRGHPSARLDVEGGADAALRHLLDLGHRRIGHLGAVFDLPTFAARVAAVERLVEGPVARATTDLGIDPSHEAALELLRAHPDLTALFCDDDVIACGRLSRRAGARAADPRGSLGRGLRRARHRAGARPAAHDGHRRRRGARPRRLRAARRAARGQAAAEPGRRGLARRARVDGSSARLSAANVNGGR